MRIEKTIDAVKKTVKQWKENGMQIGFVPTLGYLHKGHESLLERAVKENDRVVVSVFVNPTQFGPGEDLLIYPRDFEHDVSVCQEAGVNLIFYPDLEEIYMPGFCTFVDVHTLTNALCGRSRPEHFRGVCTIVNKLFHIVKADRAYFGEKDAQQFVVIRRMVRDLNMDIEIVNCPIVREEDGVALSSRNAYLNEQERKSARILNQSLTVAREMIHKGERNTGIIIGVISTTIRTEPLAKIDYVEVVDMDSLEKVDVIQQSVLIAIAVFIGNTRLIDNFIFKL